LPFFLSVYTLVYTQSVPVIFEPTCIIIISILIKEEHLKWVRDYNVTIVTRLEDLEFNSRQEKTLISFYNLCTCPGFQQASCSEVSVAPGVKQQLSENNHLTPPNA
jgi:hypothetical protein